MEHDKAKPEKDCPTAGGSFPAYAPEWRLMRREGAGWTDWERVPTKNLPSLSDGIPAPAFTGDIGTAVGLYGYAQAWALAWWFVAMTERDGRTLDVRLHRYTVEYSVKTISDGHVDPSALAVAEKKLL